MPFVGFDLQVQNNSDRWEWNSLAFTCCKYQQSLRTNQNRGDFQLDKRREKRHRRNVRWVILVSVFNSILCLGANEKWQALIDQLTFKPLQDSLCRPIIAQTHAVPRFCLTPPHTHTPTTTALLSALPNKKCDCHWHAGTLSQGQGMNEDSSPRMLQGSSSSWYEESLITKSHSDLVKKPLIKSLSLTTLQFTLLYSSVLFSLSKYLRQQPKLWIHPASRWLTALWYRLTPWQLIMCSKWFWSLSLSEFWLCTKTCQSLQPSFQKASEVFLLHW